MGEVLDVDADSVVATTVVSVGEISVPDAEFESDPVLSAHAETPKNTATTPAVERRRIDVTPGR